MKRLTLLFMAAVVVVGIFLGVLYGASLNPLYAPPNFITATSPTPTPTLPPTLSPTPTSSQREVDVLAIGRKYVEETYGTDYRLNGDGTTRITYTENGLTFTYPAASFRVPADWQQSGIQVNVAVNPETGDIIRVFTSWSKSMPPTTHTPIPTPTIPLPITAYDFYPACNATNVPLNTTIQVTISRHASVDLSLTPFVAVLNVTEEIVGVVSGRYTFILAEPLQPNTLYQATISFGNSRSWNFTTTSSPVPGDEYGHLTIVETSRGKLFTASTTNTAVHRVTFWAWKESVNDREADFRILSYPNWNGTHMVALYEFLEHGEWWTVNAQFSTHSYYFWSNTVTIP